MKVYFKRCMQCNRIVSPATQNMASLGEYCQTWTCPTCGVENPHFIQEKVVCNVFKTR